MGQELSENSIFIIKESADLVIANSVKISAKMYELLFKKYPYIKALYANAPKDMHLVFAEVFSAYAENIDNLDALSETLNAIAVAHIKNNVRADQYPLVGRVFMDSLEYVLEDEASEELLDAWREAYQYLAYVLIDIEKEMYKKIS